MHGLATELFDECLGVLLFGEAEEGEGESDHHRTQDDADKNRLSSAVAMACYFSLTSIPSPASVSLTPVWVPVSSSTTPFWFRSVATLMPPPTAAPA